MSVPFDDIKTNLDRSWTDRLLDAIGSADADDPFADAAAEALAELADPSATERLFAMATATERSVASRSRALAVISESGLSPEREDLRAWWESKDVVLQQSALQEAYRTEADYLRPVLQDQLHPLHRHAVVALGAGFDDQEWQSHVVAALSHFDPAVRETAAEIAIWEEPSAAEPALIELANGSSQGCALAAIRTLKYFRSRSSLLALHALTDHRDSERADEARESLGELASEFNREVQGVELAARDNLKTWTEPVAEIVAMYSVDNSWVNRDFTRDVLSALPFSGQRLVASLSDLTGEWAERMDWLTRADWALLSDQDRLLLRPVLLNHVDPTVRKHSARVFSLWNDVEALSQLLLDRYVMVRQQAVYWLHAVTPTQQVADALWRMLNDDLVAGWPAKEALDSWLHHFGGDATEALVDIALHDNRVGLRWSAINHLDSAHADALIPLLTVPPQVNWSLHSLVLAKLAERGGPRPDTPDFSSVDDLYVARALSAL